MKLPAAASVATMVPMMMLLLLIIGCSLASPQLNFSNFDLASNFLEDLDACYLDDDNSMVDSGRDTVPYSQSDYLIQTGLYLQIDWGLFYQIRNHSTKSQIVLFKYFEISKEPTS